MKKFATLAIASAALLGSQMAYAHHPLPVPSTMSGIVTVKKGFEFDCVLTVNFQAGGYAYVTLSPGDQRCSALKVDPNPVAYSYNATTHKVTFHNLRVTTITLGNCAGSVDADWDGDFGELIIDAMLPAETAGTGDCTIQGIIS